MARTWDIALEATLANEDAAQDFLRAALGQTTCPRKVAGELRLILEELFVNVAHYAYAPSTGTVDLALAEEPDGAGVTLTLSDQGTSFNPFARELPTAPASVEEAAIGGLGILMVERYADECAYERLGGRNVVRVLKRW